MKVTRESLFTGNTHTREIDITEEQLNGMKFTGMKWVVPGKLIQDAFPNLSNDDREFLMTGSTPEEWDAMFS